MIIERENVVESDALAIMRRFSQKSGRPRRERAEDVVAFTRQPQADPAAGS